MDSKVMMLKIGVLLTHPVQYYSPWFAKLAQACDLKVFYAHRQTPDGQALAGFDTAFEWDVPLLDGYEYQFLENVAHEPGLESFRGCDTPQLYEILREERFDALLMFGWNKKCYLQGWYGALRAGIPVFIRVDTQIASQQKTVFKPFKKLIYSMVLPYAADYLSPGQRTNEYLRYFSVPEHRIHRLAHMVDTDRFQQDAEKARIDGANQKLRALYRATDKTCIFLFVGKLIDKKRPGLLIKAFSKLKTQNVQLWFVGDGPLRPQLQAMAETEAMPVHFLGFVNQSKLPEVYAAADCLVLPSNASETWGLVVNEAFACGVPAIVSSEVGCAPELIDDGITGWTLSPANTDTLAKLLTTAVSKVHTLSSEALLCKTMEGSYEMGVKHFLQIILTKQNAINNATKNTI